MIKSLYIITLIMFTAPNNHEFSIGASIQLFVDKCQRERVECYADNLYDPSTVYIKDIEENIFKLNEDFKNFIASDTETLLSVKQMRKYGYDIEYLEVKNNEATIKIKRKNAQTSDFLKDYLLCELKYDGRLWRISGNICGIISD